MDVFATAAQAMQSVFNEDADNLAKTTGFIKRERKITGSKFIKTLLFAGLQKLCPSVEACTRSGFSQQLYISAQGLDKRFTKTSCEFVKCVLERALSKTLCAKKHLDADILNRFNAIYINDCSVIGLPDELKTIWAGTGGSGNASKASLKLDTSLELKTGQLKVHLLDGKHADNKCLSAQQTIQKGELRLQDLGYFNLARMKKQSKAGGYWVSRLQPRTCITQVDGTTIDLPYFLKNIAKDQYSHFEMDVLVGSQEQVNARLLLWKLPQEAAARRRAKLTKNAKKHGRMPKKSTLVLCDWNIFITNTEKDKLTLEECFLLYGVRWQIELLFKLWKNYSGLGHSRSKKPYRILCEIYLKLLVVLFQHWIVLTSLWGKPKRSLVKGTQMLREQSARLAECINHQDSLVALLKEFSKRFEYGCSLNTRKKKPNTTDQLIHGYQYA